MFVKLCGHWIYGRSRGYRVQRHNFYFQLCPFLPVWPWISYLMSLGLSYIIHKSMLGGWVELDSGISNAYNLCKALLFYLLCLLILYPPLQFITEILFTFKSINSVEVLVHSSMLLLFHLILFSIFLTLIIPYFHNGISGCIQHTVLIPFSQKMSSFPFFFWNWWSSQSGSYFHLLLKTWSRNISLI